MPPRIVIRSMKRSLIAIALLAPSFVFADDDATPDYAADVYPVLRKYCQGCHDVDEANGELRLDSFALLMKGGENGKAIVPGEPDESLLLKLVEKKAEPFMPPEDNAAPTAAEIAVLRKWIAAGAPRGIGVVDRFALVTPTVEPTAKVRVPVNEVARHPTKPLLALARHGRVEIVIGKTRETSATHEEPVGAVNDVRFSGDGRLLVAAAGEPGLYGQAIVWHVDEPKPPLKITGHRDALLAAAISPDGKVVATGSYDSEVKLWDVTTGKELRTLKGHNGPVFDLAFHPNGKLIATASGDRTVKLWDVATGKRLDTLGQPEKEQYALAFSPDGRFVVAAGVDNRIRVWEVTAGGREGTNPMRFARFAHDAAIVEVAFNADGTRLASSAEDGTVKLWDAESFGPLKTLPDQSDWVAGLTFSADGRGLWLGRLDGSLEKVDVGDVTAPRGETFVDAREPYDVDESAVADLDENGKATGTLEKPGEADFFRFELKAGERRVVETFAARKKWPTDTRVEVLHADGRPVLRRLLHAVRDSYITFRPIDSNTVDVRVKNWQEMELNQYLYLGGEVCRIFRMPEGPDSGFNFYKVNGKRRNYFDTSATIHAKDDPVYVVTPHEPGARIVDNGLPVFPLYFQNDDGGWRAAGRDSRLVFTAPTDGTYLIRVSDVRGQGSPNHRYELTVRPPKPDFGVSVGGKNPTVAAGSGRRMIFTANRIDDFGGPVEITVENLPPGFSAASPVTVQAGHVEARSVLYATPDAEAPTKEQWSAVRVTARATIDGKVVEKPLGDLGEIKVAKKPNVRLWLEPHEPAGNLDTGTGDIVVRPGTRTTVVLKIERNGANGPLRFDVDNLPHGVIVADLGLNGITLLPGQTERVLFLQAADWVPETDRLMHAVSRGQGEQASPPLLLHVRRGAEVAGSN